jgi:ATP-binding cassette subfamily F protein uup
VASPGAKKLSYKERRELDELPARIEALEKEHRELNEAVAAPHFYTQPAATITASLERLSAIDNELLDLYVRWEGLVSRPS